MENDLKTLDGYEEYSKISAEMQILSKHIEAEDNTDIKLHLLEKYRGLNVDYVKSTIGLINDVNVRYGKLSKKYRDIVKISNEDNKELIQQCKILINDRKLLTVTLFILSIFLVFFITK